MGVEVEAGDDDITFKASLSSTTPSPSSFILIPPFSFSDGRAGTAGATTHSDWSTSTSFFSSISFMMAGLVYY